MCEEESEDHEAVAKLFEINDSIHRTIERYKLVKKGDIEGANKIPKGTLGTSGAGVSKGPDNELSLIDFGEPEDSVPPAQESSSAPAQSAKKGNALEDDLLGLSIGDEPYGQTGNIALGASNGAGKAPFMFYLFSRLLTRTFLRHWCIKSFTASFNLCICITCDHFALFINSYSFLRLFLRNLKSSTATAAACRT